MSFAAALILAAATVSAPVAEGASGRDAQFASAEVNVPPGGEQITITLGDRAA